MTIPEIIAHASSLSVIVPLALYLVHFRRANKPVHIIGVLMVVAGLCDLAGFILYQSHKSTAVVFNVYYSAVFFLLSYFYYEIFFRTRHKAALFIGVAVYIIAFVLITFYVQEFFFYQNLVWMIGAIIMILFSITSFVNSLSAIPSTHLFSTSTIWVNTGILFYFSLSLFLFSMGDYLFNRQDPQVTLLLWSTHNVNNLIKNVLFAVAMNVLPVKVTAPSRPIRTSLLVEEN
jgi:hypothetical protein